MSKLEDIALATTQNETQREKRQGEKRNRESFPCSLTSQCRDWDRFS